MMVTRQKPLSELMADDRAQIVMDPHRRLNIHCQEIPELIQHLRAVYTAFVNDACQEVFK
jgi:hypothetical protein